MHRTTTTATLLVTVAVTALSGCVTIQHPTAPGPLPAPSQPSVPRPDGRAEPQIVQAPAREALELIGPDREPPQAPRTPRAVGEPHRPAAAAPAPPPAAAPPPPRRTKPKKRPPKPQRRHTQPRVELPEVSRPVRENTDVCALGRKYGGWGKDSPQTVICKEAYGR
ncbi:hypothetical protein PV735_37895 [Streptomyces turgidiscabies]|uniref:hypothetical protein n=1 Tax=Streptomyces sp. B21-083 TaxID=3039410 RepID=UPI0002E9FE33|nr:MULTISPECIES: hypothetical protein [Streptomyces]MDX3498419.1 hypothetical protein [Streptomyces turgidiscabies]